MEEEKNEENNYQKDDLPSNEIKPAISPIAAAFIGLVGGFFLYQIVGGILTILIFGTEIDKAPVNLYRLMTIGGQVLFILLPALLFSKWIYSDVDKIIRIKIPRWKEIGLFTLGILVLTPLFQNYLYIQNYFIEIAAKHSPFINTLKTALDTLDDLVEKTYVDLLNANNIFEGLLVVALIAVVPAFCEEAMFRGFIQRSFEFKMKPFYAALITAVFFGIYHFNPYALIPLIGLGLYFGFAAYTSETILLPVFLHFLNNFIAVILYFIFGDDDIISSSISSEADIGSSIALFFFMLLIFAGVVFLIKKYYSQLRNA